MKAGMKKIKDLSQLLPEPVCPPHQHHCLSGVLSGPPVQLYQRFLLLNHDQSFPARQLPALHQQTHREERLCLDPHCNDFHMCSPSPFFFLFLPSHLLTPLPPPPSYLPLSFLPHSSSLLSLLLLFQLFFLSYKKTKKWMSPFLLPMSHNAVLCMADENVSVKKSDCGTYLLLSWSAGEREEVHAAPGQPEGARRGEEFYVQQAHILHL